MPVSIHAQHCMQVVNRRLKVCLHKPLSYWLNIIFVLQVSFYMNFSSLQEEDALRGMTSQGLLSNMQQPLVGLGKRMQWIPLESVAYGNTSASKKEVVTVSRPDMHGLHGPWHEHHLRPHRNDSYPVPPMLAW